MNKHPINRRLIPSVKQLRSAVTNGTQLLIGTDHRSAAMRRLRDINAGYVSDMGGDDRLSEGERALIRRAAMLQLQLEVMEARFAQNEDGAASSKMLGQYIKACGALARLCKAVGLRRRPRDVTPTLDQYVRNKRHRLEAAE